MRACGADHIEPTGTRLAGVDDDVCSTILFPHRVTLTEHKWVILGERRGRSKEGARGRVASLLGGGLNALVDCVSQSDRSFWHQFLHRIKEMAEGVRDAEFAIFYVLQPIATV